MKRKLMWMAAGALIFIAVAGISCLAFLKFFASGFSARSDPSFLETVAAQQARSMAMPHTVESEKTRLPVLRE